MVGMVVIVVMVVVVVVVVMMIMVMFTGPFLRSHLTWKWLHLTIELHSYLMLLVGKSSKAAASA
jgi:hypothetical protein